MLAKRLIPSFKKRVARLTWPNGRGIVRRDGVLYLLNLNSGDWVDTSILTRGAVEPEQRSYLFDQVRRRQCNTFLDIGANFGTYATCAALQTDCKTILAFEPDQRSYDRLRSNLLINGVADKVKTYLAAVSDHTGTVPYKLGPANDNSSSEIGDDGSGFTVPSIKLDDELPLSGHKIAFKIDAQYHELTILQGMKALLKNNECFLQVECFGKYVEPFEAAMKDVGYRHIHTIDYDYYFEHAN